MLSVIIFIGLTNVLSFASGGLTILLEEILSDKMAAITSVNITLSIVLAGTVLIGLIGYFVTNKIMKSRLNLE